MFKIKSKNLEWLETSKKLRKKNLTDRYPLYYVMSFVNFTFQLYLEWLRLIYIVVYQR